MAGIKPSKNMNIFIFSFNFRSVEDFIMLVRLVDKQRRAVSVVKTALLGAGITGCSVCVSAFKWSCNLNEDDAKFAVFVSAPKGANIEPSYET